MYLCYHHRVLEEYIQMYIRGEIYLKYVFVKHFIYCKVVLTNGALM